MWVLRNAQNRNKKQLKVKARRDMFWALFKTNHVDVSHLHDQ